MHHFHEIQNFFLLPFPIAFNYQFNQRLKVNSQKNNLSTLTEGYFFLL
ncbi:hypothetical protein HMPREF9071_0668 [Capnocytophaga sp. oral taxon 338 str. F0234]|nr:hypothetical protein HMPREF9071_0668 [Capnocytophaga sp. oral taxon 338 str. F0234]